MKRASLTLGLFIAAFCFGGCSKTEEVRFRLCMRKLQAGYYPAEENVDLNTFYQVMRSQLVWDQISPRVGVRISDPEKFRSSLKMRKGAFSSEADASRLEIFISASGARNDDIVFALQLMIDGLADYLASHQPNLVSYPLKPVPYYEVTGSKEKLYRFIER